VAGRSPVEGSWGEVANLWFVIGEWTFWRSQNSY
jgi:hypothetical protein